MEDSRFPSDYWNTSENQGYLRQADVKSFEDYVEKDQSLKNNELSLGSYLHDPSASISESRLMFVANNSWHSEKLKTDKEQINENESIVELIYDEEDNVILPCGCKWNSEEYNSFIETSKYIENNSLACSKCA